MAVHVCVKCGTKYPPATDAEGEVKCPECGSFLYEPGTADEAPAAAGELRAAAPDPEPDPEPPAEAPAAEGLSPDEAAALAELQARAGG